MNQIYKVIWNVSRQVWMAVGELTSSRGKNKSVTSKCPHRQYLSGVASALVLFSLSAGSVLAEVATTGNVNPIQDPNPSASWDLGGNNLFVGDTGVGSLLIDDGSTVSNNFGYIGRYDGDNGSVTVDSSGSSWTNTSMLFVGLAGDGSLAINNGGTVSNTLGYIGSSASSSGWVTVDGANSSWINSEELTVGRSGTGSLTISNGGAVSNTLGSIGGNSAGNGSVTVDGANSSWTNSSSIYVGEYGTGSLDISNGGAVSNTIGVIGRWSGSNGSVTVDGTDSSWINSTDLTVGRAGTGSLDISNGAVVETNSGAGTLTIANQASATGTVNIGAAAGEGAVAAGTLSAASVVFGAGTGKLVFNHTEAAYEFAPTISGAGSVELYSGKTIFTGANTYSGGTSINAGTLQVGNGGTSGSVIGDISNNGSLVFNRSDSVTYADVISGTGSLTQSGAGSLTLTGNNTYSGVTSINAGTLQIGNGGTTGSISGDISNNGSLVFNRTDSQTFAGDISGAGSINLASGSTRFTGNLSSYTGTLSNDATLSVADGKTLTLGGNYSQTADGIFNMGASSSSSFGKLLVNGTATFAGDSKINVDVTSEKNLANGATLSSVISAGTLDASTFAVTDNSALFNFSAAINGNQVDLKVSAASSSGVTKSVTATGFNPGLGAARVLDGFVSGGSTGTDMDNVVEAFGQLSTDQQISDAVAETLPLLVSGTTQVATGTLRSTNRVIQARQSGFSGLSSGDGFFTDKNVWVKPVGSWTTQDERNGVSGYRADSYGMVGGMDGELNAHTRLGFALSYMSSDVKGRDSASGNKVDIDAYQAIFYGSRSLQNHPDIELNWQASLGMNKNEGKRTMRFIGRTAKADYDSYTAQIGVGAGKRFELNDTTTLIPSIRADYAYIKDESYTEKGAGALNMDVGSNHVDEFVVMAQSHISHQLNDTTSLTANAGLGYDFINDTTSLTASYSGGGAAFTTKGIDPSPWLGRAGVGLNFSTSDTSEITARYDVEGREDFLNQTASVKFRWMF